MRLSQAERIQSAKISGTAEHWAAMGRSTREIAKAEIATLVAALPADRRRSVLNEAAAAYVAAADPRPYYPQVADLLVECGADRDEATAVYAARHKGPGAWSV